ncbi:DNA-binding domain-containing protein [uncultured Methylibium sp.]|uniref:HvfC/BufC N-terminal domain-containing protein n=1 Tax=uncultured Methylibium sp. TaxID=381093 RepID=UPI0025DF893F|nr:DNA-binding domain-containing protein [uncultured Methylibium sp.]
MSAEGRPASAALLGMQSLVQQHVIGTADAAALIDGDAAHAAQRLGIYAQAYRLRLIDALADAYAKTRACLGADRFERAALRYIDAQPPTTRSLRWFGDGLADALAGWLPREPAVAELARLDWALRGAFDGPDAPVLDAAALGAVAPEAWGTLKLVLHPTARLLVFEHNTVAVWQALDDDTEPPPLERGDHPVAWLVWRKGLQPHFRSLHPAEAALLQGALGGTGFAASCEHAAARAADDTPDELQLRIGACLRQWADDDLLSAIVDA